MFQNPKSTLHRDRRRRNAGRYRRRENAKLQDAIDKLKVMSSLRHRRKLRVLKGTRASREVSGLLDPRHDPRYCARSCFMPLTPCTRKARSA